MDNLCRNCGHEKSFHMALISYWRQCDFETEEGFCGCTLFQPKEEKTPEDVRFENALADYWDRRSGACEEEG
jgi:hypothetical protein